MSHLLRVIPCTSIDPNRLSPSGPVTGFTCLGITGQLAESGPIRIFTRWAGSPAECQWEFEFRPWPSHGPRSWDEPPMVKAKKEGCALPALRLRVGWS
eukprot:770641-Rhodomonas_salina.1